jgi:hypothetical protein
MTDTDTSQQGRSQAPRLIDVGYLEGLVQGIGNDLPPHGELASPASSRAQDAYLFPSLVGDGLDCLQAIGDGKRHTLQDTPHQVLFAMPVPDAKKSATSLGIVKGRTLPKQVGMEEQPLTASRGAGSQSFQLAIGRCSDLLTLETDPSEPGQH